MRDGNTRRIAAAFIIAFQSVMALVVSLTLFASAHRVGRWALGETVAHRRAELGGALLLVALAACVIAVSLAAGAGWARIAAMLFEACVVIAAVARIGVRPGPALVSLAVAAIVVILVWRDAGQRRHTGPGTSGDAAGSSLPLPAAG